VYELDLRREKLVDAIAHQGVSLPAADLHQYPGTRDAPRDLRQEGTRDARVTVFIEVLHSYWSILRMVAARRRNETFLLQRTQLLEQLEGALSLLCVQPAESKAHVDDNVIADLGLRDKIQMDLADDAAEIHTA
jgi:hypothetical protein